MGGYSEVELVQKMIDGVNKLWEEDKKLQAGGTVEMYRAMPAQTNGPFPNIQSKHSLVASHVSKPVLLSLTTSTVESMLVTGTPTRTLLLSSILSFRSTTESLLTPGTPLTWTPPRSMETLLLMFLFTLPGFVLDVPLMDLVCLLEFPR